MSSVYNRCKIYNWYWLSVRFHDTWCSIYNINVTETGPCFYVHSQFHIKISFYVLSFTVFENDFHFCEDFFHFSENLVGVRCTMEVLGIIWHWFCVQFFNSWWSIIFSNTGHLLFILLKVVGKVESKALNDNTISILCPEDMQWQQ